MLLGLIVCLCIALLLGFPVAFVLAGVSLLFALIGGIFGLFDLDLLRTYPLRVYGLLNNYTLLAVPLFIFMGHILERSDIAKQMFVVLAKLTQNLRGGLGISLIVVGGVMAASTGIVGASVVTLSLISLHGLLKQGYHPRFVAGIVTSTGTLGQLIPPSIALILLGEVMSNAWQQAQLEQQIYHATPLTIGELFVGAIGPGFLLILGFVAAVLVLPYFFKDLISQENKQAYQAKLKDLAQHSQQEVNSQLEPKDIGAISESSSGILFQLLASVLPPLCLISLVLGSILFGWSTTTEAAAVGALGALVLVVFQNKFSWSLLWQASEHTVRTTSMIFAILLGASLFSLVFRGYEGEQVIEVFFSNFQHPLMAVIVAMVILFLLGFILDFIEIIFVFVPLLAVPLLLMGVDPVWLAVLVAVNLQTSFLSPPFGFSLFYFKGASSPWVDTLEIYKGVIPFIVLQLLVLIALFIWPEIATGLPALVYGSV